MALNSGVNYASRHQKRYNIINAYLYNSVDIGAGQTSQVARLVSNVDIRASVKAKSLAIDRI